MFNTSFKRNNGNKTKEIFFENKNLTFSNEDCNVIAGPCSIESFEQLDKIAEFLKSQNVNFLRGGAFKPRTSPYEFQGLGIEGLKFMHDVGVKHNMVTISEMMDVRDIDHFMQYIDVIQIGSRNMSNFSLLKEVGKSNKPVVLKRGMSATLQEWLYSAEYILSEGNDKIILCERGIRTFEDKTRNTLDLAGAYLLKQQTTLPIIIDPSHGTGIRELVTPMALTSAQMGFSGIMIEVHFDPENAKSDGKQTLDFNEFKYFSTLKYINDRQF